jgi:endonuclease YncB( thermonuclease family)
VRGGLLFFCVIVDGENLGDMLVEAGMAVRYDVGKETV